MSIMILWVATPFFLVEFSNFWVELTASIIWEVDKFHSVLLHEKLQSQTMNSSKYLITDH